MLYIIMMNNLNSFDMLKLLGFRDNIFIGKLFMYGVTELRDNGKCCPSITKTAISLPSYIHKYQYPVQILKQFLNDTSQ